MKTDDANLIGETAPLTADQWAERWQQEADARNALFRDYLKLKSERDELREWVMNCLRNK